MSMLFYREYRMLTKHQNMASIDLFDQRLVPLIQLKSLDFWSAKG